MRAEEFGGAMGRLKAICGLEEEANVKSGSDVYLVPRATAT